MSRSLDRRAFDDVWDPVPADLSINSLPKKKLILQVSFAHLQYFRNHLSSFLLYLYFFWFCADVTPNGTLRRRRSRIPCEGDDGNLMDFLRTSGQDSARERKSWGSLGKVLHTMKLTQVCSINAVLT